MSYETVLLVYFFTLCGVIALWLVLAKMLFGRLSRFYPKTFDALGSPDLRDGGTGPQQNFRLLKFLSYREFMLLHDTHISRVCGIMRVLLVVIPVHFVGGLLFLVALQ